MAVTAFVRARPSSPGIPLHTVPPRLMGTPNYVIIFKEIGIFAPPRELRATLHRVDIDGNKQGFPIRISGDQVHIENEDPAFASYTLSSVSPDEAKAIVQEVSDNAFGALRTAKIYNPDALGSAMMGGGVEIVISRRAY